LNPGTTLSTIVSPTSPAMSAPDSRQGTASPSGPQTAPLNAIPPAVTASTREATTELPQQPVAASNSPQTAPLNALPTAVTASTMEATTELPKQPSASGRYAHERGHKIARILCGDCIRLEQSPSPYKLRGQPD